MIIHTASEGITLARKLENESALFYEGLALISRTLSPFHARTIKEHHPDGPAYYGVITDALEGGYALPWTDNTLTDRITKKGNTLILETGPAIEARTMGSMLKLLNSPAR
jgi:hypothetical protein